ncbi:MAG TPA: non-homologous end-joining DNA ligase [Steroidobacteraceae bacterium]|nr:non-homologous end-joining DNA ligase [Steroidobacteraceae bacterium]
MNSRIPFRARPMLATLVSKPFDAPGWVFEEKYDGKRMLAYKQGARVVLLSRNDMDNTDRFPGVAAAIKALRPATLLLDGEIVVFDRTRVSRFQLLQQGKGAPVYVVFDCLFAGGKDLRHEPLSARRAALERLVPSRGALLLSHRIASNGLQAYGIAKRKGYEGLLAKDLSSPYVGGRSRFWLKVKTHQEDEFVIVGYTAPRGSRRFLGALLLGAYARGKLHYVGKVGTGFNARTLAELYKQLKPLATSRTTLVEAARERDVTYVRPRVVAQISYQEWTADRRLRQPVFLGLRDDKRPEDVGLPQAQVFGGIAGRDKRRGEEVAEEGTEG